MLSTLTRHGYRLGLLIALIAALAVFVPAGFTQDPQNSPDASHDQNRIDTPVDKSADTPADSEHLQKPSDDKSLETDNKLTDKDVQSATGKVDLDRLESYAGQQVTLRGDVDKISADVTDYVRENPGKSLLIAAGVGFVVGLLLRRNRED